MHKPVTEFLFGLRMKLERLVSKAKSDEILRELQSHLEESIHELVRSGLSRDQATEEAINRLGDQDKVALWYLQVHRRPSVWRACRWPLLILVGWEFAWRLWAALGLPYSYDSRFIFHINFHLLLILTGFCLLIAACYRSRRFSSGAMAVGLVLYCGALFVYACFTQVPIAGQHGYYAIAKREVPAQIAAIRKERGLAITRLALLEKGFKVFESRTPTPEGVAQFKTKHGRYVTPSSIQMQEGLGPKLFLENRSWDGMVDDWAEARNFWRNQPFSVSKTGERAIYYLAEARDQIWVADKNLAELPRAVAKPFTAHLWVYVQVFTFFLPTTLAKGVLADLIAGLARMAVEAISRKRRRGKGPLSA